MMKISLKVRVFALVCVLVVTSMSALAYCLLGNLKDRLKDDFRARGAIIVKHFALNSSEGIIIEDEEGLTQTVESLFEIQDVVYASVYDAEGTQIICRSILLEGDTGSAQETLSSSTRGITQVFVGQDNPVPVLDFRAPANDENGERVGSVQVGLSLESIDSEMQAMATRVFMLLALFVSVGTVASFLVANSIANPIKALTRVFAVIAGGDLDHEIDTRRNDELGSLSRNFAAMRDSIRDKLLLLENEALVRRHAEQELERHRDNLEELVRERTAELASANTELKAEIAEREQVQEHLKQSLDELARHNDAMMGREKRIVELKGQINDLLGELERDDVFGNEESARHQFDGPLDTQREEQNEVPFDAANVLKEMKELQGLLESFCESVGIAAAIIDLKGEVLVGARWQKICTDFHRQNPQTCQKCIESDTVIANQVDEGERFCVYTCKNGLTDAASPIIVRGSHIANLFVGQFLLDSPDVDFFRMQAAEHGFPEAEYLAALGKVPILDRPRLKSILSFLSEFSVVLGSLGVGQFDLSRTNDELRHSREALLSLMEDSIEAKKKAEEYARQAESANETKSAFLANMSHEIRTPMTAILGFADVLLERGDRSNAPPERVEAIKTIKRNGEYLLSIINDILDLSKVEAGKLNVENIACQPCGIVAEVASLMQVKADSQGLSFKIEYTGAVPETIQTDPTRLRQILVNLLGNAIKFTESGSVSLITGFINDADQPLMQFDVVDTGIGMSAEQAARLFQPFTQADATTTRRFGGTGLGLSISKRFAEMLGGDIVMVESQAGVGTRFRATVSTGPLTDVNMISDPLSATTVSSKPPAETSRAEELSLAGTYILLAEDGPDNRRLISHILKKAEARVTVVENGKLAVDAALAAYAAGEAYDVILMDMQMPVMDGYEATALLRRMDYEGAIIALTANAMASDRDKCIKAGCSDYAIKPINRGKLIETIAEQLRLPTAAPAT